MVDSSSEATPDMLVLPDLRTDRLLRPARYQLDVVAASIVDVVEHAGGWLFDRALAGWEVTVLVVGGSDARPLRILGARTADLEPILAARGGRRLPQALGVAPDLCARDPRAHDLLNEWGRRVPEVVMWAQACAPDLIGGAKPSRHTLSAAARTFKAHALAAELGVRLDIGTTETFLRSGLPGGSSPIGDLRPVF